MLKAGLPGCLHHVCGQRFNLALTQLRAITGHRTDSLCNGTLDLSKAGAELVEVWAHDAAGIGIGEAMAHTAPGLRLLEEQLLTF